MLHPYNITVYPYTHIYIVWTKRNNTIQPDLVEASLEELKCADCWPWEKYREDGETERSPKPGPKSQQFSILLHGMQAMQGTVH
jgi:hypothetical protein